MSIARRFAMACTLMCVVNAASAVELMEWQRLPLPVPLQVGRERIIFVDQNVRVGVPQSLSDRLRIQSNEGALYLLASDVIEPTRLQLQNVTTGEIILIDINATVDTSALPLEPLKIIRAVTEPSSKPQPEGANEIQPLTQTPIPVVLTRYAAQNLYAPLRTVEPLRGVNQIRINPRLNLGNLLPALSVSGSVLGAWQYEDYWVTAVLLRNQSAHDIPLDPRELNGDFYSATFQHQYLGPEGTPADSTTVYLVTKSKPLQAALYPIVSTFDASTNLPASRSNSDEK